MRLSTLRHVIQIQHPQTRIGVHLEMQRLQAFWRHPLDSFNPKREMPLAVRHSKQDLLRAISLRAESRPSGCRDSFVSRTGAASGAFR